jgi:threonine/homoserine/homoserine lactone efflux protein
MSAEISSLLLALGILLVSIFSIGPNILAIIGTSMEKGRKAGILLALGVGTGSAVWSTLTVAGLSALISAYAVLVVFLKIFGTGYLIWLAYKSFCSAASTAKMKQLTPAKGKNLYFQGLMIMLTNPKAALGWIAIVGIGLGHEAPLWVGLALIASATTISFTAHILFALTFSTGPIVRFYQRSRRWIDGALGLFFSVAAYKIAIFRN